MIIPKKKRFFAGAKRARYASSTSFEWPQDNLHSLLSSNANVNDSLTDSERSSYEEDNSQINVVSIEANCYVVAKVTTDKHCFKQFVGNVLAGRDNDKDYTISFLVRCRRFKNRLCSPKKKIQHHFLNKKS